MTTGVRDLETGAGAPLYFVCYARAERDLVSKVEAKLAARRRRGELDVWRDVRNLDVWEKFTPEILAALQRAAGAIVVVSDAWYRSDYIHDYEWPTILARKEQESRFGIFLLAFNDLDSNDPLRARNFVNDLHRELLLGCSDAVRDGVLTRLSDLIGEHARSHRQQTGDAPTPTVTRVEPVASAVEDPPDAYPAGVLDGVPELPEQFVEPDELEALSAQVAAGGVTAITGLQGEGGTGKSVLAAAVARQTAHLFSGGAHWVTVGEHATSEDVRRLQAGLVASFGGEPERAPQDITEGKEMLAAALARRAVLIVVDDVWHPWQARAFDTARPGGMTRVLFTTRFPEALPAGSATAHMARLGLAEATAFLGRLPSGVPPAMEDLSAVLDAAGGLRLALAVLAATASVEGSWAPVLSRLGGLAVRFGYGDDASSAQKALFVALDTLDADDRRLAGTLGAFPADTAIPVDLLAELWDVPRSRANRLVDGLAAKDLVARADDRLVLHDHVHDFLVLQARTPASEVHLKLWELTQQKLRRGWPAFADDEPYLWDHLAWHACRAGLNRRTLWEFVSDLEWLAERIRRQGPAAAEQDVGQVCDTTALTDAAPLSRLRRVLRHGGLFDAAGAGASLEVSLAAWADVVGLGHPTERLVHSGSLPVPSSALLKTLRGHSSEVWGVALSSQDRFLATSSEDSTVRIWDTRTGESALTLTGHGKQVWGVAFSGDDRRLATAGADGTARLWDSGTGRVVRTLAGHTGEVWGVAFSRDDRRLATAGADGTARIWDVSTGEPVLTLNAQAGLICRVSFSHDGRRLATASADGTARVWDTSEGTLVLSVTGHAGPVFDVNFSRDGRLLATAGEDGTARIWDALTGAPLRTLTGHANRVWGADFSRDGRRLATAGEDGTARIWDADTAEPMLVLAGHTNPVHGVLFSSDGRRLATVGGDGTARIWNADTSKPDSGPVGPASEVHDVVFSPGYARLATAGGDGTARIWDTSTGKPVLTLTGHASPVWGVALSSDDRLVAAASEDRTARIWDALTGAPLRTLTGHTSHVWDVSFSYDRRLLATASEDETARIWDTGTGEQLFVLTGHTGPVWEVAFSSDDRRLVTSGSDGTARIWDTRNGEPVLVTAGRHGHRVGCRLQLRRPVFRYRERRRHGPDLGQPHG